MSSSIKKDGGDSGVGKPQKYLFDKNDFDPKKPVVAAAPVFSEAEIEKARADSFTLGKQTGVSDTKQTIDQKTADCLEKITAALDQLVAQERRREIDKNIDATQMALRIVAKLLPSLAPAASLDEIVNTVSQNVDERTEEPRIVVIVHDTMLEPLRQQVGKIAEDRGYGGKIIILAEETMPATDCRIEWADGGAERVFERLFMMIENEVAKIVAAHKQMKTDEINNKGDQK